MNESRARALALIMLSTLGCAPEGEGEGENNDSEIISRVELTFIPADGGEPLVFAFSDPDGDGGISGTAEPIVLALDTQYELRLGFINDLVDPPEVISDEIEAEAEQHFVFLLGDGVIGPASSSAAALVEVAYADLESDYGENRVGDDLPVGLVHTIDADVAGTATLRVMLRHLPELNGTPQKSAALPAMLAAGETLAGDVDVDLEFELTVQ